jgi:hypothetical protein
MISLALFLQLAAADAGTPPEPPKCSTRERDLQREVDRLRAENSAIRFVCKKRGSLDVRKK